MSRNTLTAAVAAVAAGVSVHFLRKFRAEDKPAKRRKELSVAAPPVHHIVVSFIAVVAPLPAAVAVASSGGCPSSPPHTSAPFRTALCAFACIHSTQSTVSWSVCVCVCG